MFDLISNLKPVYFWDTNVAHLDTEKNAHFIIRRVFEMGTIDEIALIHAYYGEEECRSALLTSEYLRETAIIQGMVFLNIPQRTMFKSFDKKQHHTLI